MTATATPHSHDAHSTKCMRESAKVMGFELHSIYHWTYGAIMWLSMRGTVSISGDDDMGWTVIIESNPEAIWTQPDVSVCSGGHSLCEALCGAVHALRT